MRRLGPVPLLDVVALCYMVRMAAYATLPHWSSPWAVLGVEALHGVTFGLGWGVGTNVAKLIAPPGYAATLQGAFQGSYFGLGYGIGALSGGFISHRFGFPVMFSTAALVVCVMWCCLSLIRQRMSNLAGAGARHAGSPPSNSLPGGDQMLLGGPGLLAWILDLLRTAVVKGRPSRLTYTALQSARHTTVYSHGKPKLLEKATAHLNAHRVMAKKGSGKHRPDQGALPAKGKEYPGVGYKRLRDKPPKAQQQQQPAAAQ
ncbi:hypothetical protein QJQ45_009592 [Haematococcus lacustris]|nr:hypothetical protein QJQ45_009592 [Haematococcus lacustris]